MKSLHRKKKGKSWSLSVIPHWLNISCDDTFFLFVWTLPVSFSPDRPNVVNVFFTIATGMLFFVVITKDQRIKMSDWMAQWLNEVGRLVIIDGGYVSRFLFRLVVVCIGLDSLTTVCPMLIPLLLTSFPYFFPFPYFLVLDPRAVPLSPLLLSFLPSFYPTRDKNESKWEMKKNGGKKFSSPLSSTDSSRCDQETFFATGTNVCLFMFWMNRVMMGWGSSYSIALLLFVSNDRHPILPLFSPFLTLSFFQLLLIPFPPLYFFLFLLCTMRRQWKHKNPYRDRATIWLNFQPACIHFWIFFLVFLSHTLFPLILSIAPNSFQRLYLYYHTQPGIGKNKGDKNMLHHYQQLSNTKFSLWSLFKSSGHALLFPFFSHSLPRLIPPLPLLHSLFPILPPFFCWNVLSSRINHPPGLVHNNDKQNVRLTDRPTRTHNRPIGTIIFKTAIIE